MSGSVAHHDALLLQTIATLRGASESLRTPHPESLHLSARVTSVILALQRSIGTTAIVDDDVVSQAPLQSPFCALDACMQWVDLVRDNSHWDDTDRVAFTNVLAELQDIQRYVEVPVFEFADDLPACDAPTPSRTIGSVVDTIVCGNPPPMQVPAAVEWRAPLPHVTTTATAPCDTLASSQGVAAASLYNSNSTGDDCVSRADTSDSVASVPAKPRPRLSSLSPDAYHVSYVIDDATRCCVDPTGSGDTSGPSRACGFQRVDRCFEEWLPSQATHCNAISHAKKSCSVCSADEDDSAGRVRVVDLDSPMTSPLTVNMSSLTGVPTDISKAALADFFTPTGIAVDKGRPRWKLFTSMFDGIADRADLDLHAAVMLVLSKPTGLDTSLYFKRSLQTGSDFVVLRAYFPVLDGYGDVPDAVTIECMPVVIDKTTTRMDVFEQLAWAGYVMPGTPVSATAAHIHIYAVLPPVRSSSSVDDDSSPSYDAQPWVTSLYRAVSSGLSVLECAGHLPVFNVGSATSCGCAVNEVGGTDDGYLWRELPRMISATGATNATLAGVGASATPLTVEAKRRYDELMSMLGGSSEAKGHASASQRSTGVMKATSDAAGAANRRGLLTPPSTSTALVVSWRF